MSEAQVQLVAILTGRGGPVLPAGPTPPVAAARRCDPHRPWRAGAAPRRDEPGQVAIHLLRSSPAVEGRCCPAPRRAGPGGHPPVAILTGRGGPVLLDNDDRPRTSLANHVAILTGRGGPVLPSWERMDGGAGSRLRSSPAVEGRCCDGKVRVHQVAIHLLRSSPAVEGRCCRWERHVGAARLGQVAILTGRGGPVLHGRADTRPEADLLVAILTGRGGPVLPSRRPRSRRWACRCDPHRPWRAGAAFVRTDRTGKPVPLRSSPAVEGRCCAELVADIRKNGLVAILTGRGGPVLRYGRAVHRGARSPVVAILTGRGGPVLPPVNGQTRRCAGVAILTGRGGPVLPVRQPSSSPYVSGLRSSPAVEGRCCRARPHAAPV